MINELQKYRDNNFIGVMFVVLMHAHEFFKWTKMFITDFIRQKQYQNLFCVNNFTSNF